MDAENKDAEDVQAGDPESVEKSILLLKSGQLNDIATLHQGFDLQRMPQNYLNKRSYIEKLIFHATMSDALKSPFSGFTMANRFLSTMDSIDVISGMRSLKALAKIAIPSNQRTSVMVHRIGNTWLLDEFDTDSFLLAGEQSREWHWLRKFLMKKNIFLCPESFSRNALILRDLYIKFLYHTVNQSPHMGLQINSGQPFNVKTLYKSLPAPSPNDSGSDWDSESPEGTRSCGPLASSSSSMNIHTADDPLPQSVNCNTGVKGSPKRSWTANPDVYLHTAKWQLQDLSFLVGSDLAIFGTPKHPCISLKLSPMHESINVLTGVDIWLENILNEVPEVAMCYHHEGIVMQEYELYKTGEIPVIAGFETKQIYRTVQNIIMFLKRNATQEGHTYWLVKEPECNLVKLYDLTTLCENDKCVNELNRNPSETQGVNPFILPVATLCYRLAELRWNEYQLDGAGKLIGLSGASAAAVDDQAENEHQHRRVDSLTDALRLVRNCLNLISLAERGGTAQDSIASDASDTIPAALSNLKTRAVLLLCRLYLSTPCNLLNNCIQCLQTDVKPSCGVASVNVQDLTRSCNPHLDETEEPRADSTEDREQEDSALMLNTNSTTVQQFHQLNRRLLGNVLLDAFKSSDTARLSQLASGVIQSCTAAIPISLSSGNTHPSPRPDTLTHFHGSSTPGASVTMLLSVAMVKVCLSKAQECWSRSSQLMCNKFPQAAVLASQLRSGFRHLLSALILLEHLVPDAHSNALCTDTPTGSKNAVCPYCAQPGLGTTTTVTNNSSTNAKSRRSSLLDRSVLTNLLRIASCLFSASIVCYTDAVRQLDRVEYTSKLKPVRVDQSERVLLQSACAAGVEQFDLLLEAVMTGPYFCKVGDEPPDGLVECGRWLDVLHLAARCLHRVFRAKTRPSCSSPDENVHTRATKRGKHRKHADAATGDSNSSSVAFAEVQPLMELQSHGTHLTLCFHWWPVLVNTYVLSLRKKWFYEVALNQTTVSDRFSSELDRALSMIWDPALNIYQLNGKSQFLTSTNEFQLYKLAAAASQNPPLGSWSHAFRSYPLEESPILPLASLIWEGEDTGGVANGDDGEKNRKTDGSAEKRRPRKVPGSLSAKFSLTSVCLARAIESLLRHFSILESRNSASDEIHTQLITCLLIASNEYIPSCLNGPDSVKDPNFINVLHAVIKQVMRRLPEEFTGNPSQRAVPSTKNASRNLILQTLDFRLNQVTVALYKHSQHSMTNGGQTHSSMWFTIVGQARTALDWHLTHLSLPTTVEQLSDPMVMRDMCVCLRLVHRLVTLQIANLDVLSLSGLMAILKDISMTYRIIRILKDLPSSAMDTEGPESPESTVQLLFYNLVTVCLFVSYKYRIKPISRGERKSGGGGGSRKKVSGSSANATASSSNVVPEVELTDRLLTNPPILKECQCQNFTEFATVLKEHGLGSLGSLCHVFVEKLDLLRQFLV